MITIPTTHWGIIGRTVLVRCPKCATVGPLDHDVDAAGNVIPSLVCPEQIRPNVACGFHETVTLEGWPDGGLYKVF